jgi:hypothetical protein
VNHKELEALLDSDEPQKQLKKQPRRPREEKDKLADYRADPRRMGHFIEPKYT